MLTYWAFNSLINLATSTTVGFLVFWKNKKQPLNITYSLFCLCTSIWAYAYFRWQISDNPIDALLWCRGLMAGAIFIPIFYLHHLLILVRQNFKKRNLIIFSYFFGFTFLLLSFSPFYINSVKRKMFFEYWPNATPLFSIFCIVWFWFCLYGIWIIAKQYLISKGIFKEQLKYVLVATSIGWGGTFTNFPLWFNIEIPPIGNIFASFYLLLTTYAIIKYRLMDIRLAITRVGIFFIVYALVLGVPFLLLYKYHMPHHALWLMLILATSGPYIYTFLRKKAESKLLQEQKAYQTTLRQASYGIGKIKNLNTLMKLINRILTRSAGIAQCTIYLTDEKDDAENHSFNLTQRESSFPPGITIPPPVLLALKKHNKPFIIEELIYHNQTNLNVQEMAVFLQPFQAEIIIPIVQSETLLSLILLGEKKNQSPYTDDDLTVFTIMASQAGLAIENCLFIEAEKERLHNEGANTRRESLDMLVSTMAHEIDNPIQGAICQTEMLKVCLDFFRHHLPKEAMEEVKQHCARIEFNCLRVSKIVKAVENYSKRETGHLKIVAFQDIIIPYHSLVPMIQKRYKDVTYTEEIEDLLPPIWAEEIMVEEILMNLVENAYQAVSHNEGKKTVHLHVFKNNAGLIRIEVKDNGYGISPKIKKQLFHVPTTTKGSSEGTGLGLYRVRQICEILKASYGAKSEGHSKGALFYTELPAHKGVNSLLTPKEYINEK